MQEFLLIYVQFPLIMLNCEQMFKEMLKKVILFLMEKEYLDLIIKLKEILQKGIRESIMLVKFTKFFCNLIPEKKKKKKYYNKNK